MKRNLAFRAWYYFRTGWAMYFAFIFAAVNTLVVTYFLAIENYPFLKEIFPTFQHYFVIISFIGVPLLITIGYIHFKKTQAFDSEIEIAVESNPFWYRLHPGWNTEVVFPTYLLLTKLLLKMSDGEKISEDEKQEIIQLQKKMNLLIKGGFVGNPKKKVLPKSNDIIDEDNEK